MQSPPSNQNSTPTALADRRKILVYPPEYHARKFGQLCVFGPNYRLFSDHDSLCESTKITALNCVLRASQSSSKRLMDVMESIEQAAREAYADIMVNGLRGLEFQKIMALDGCFFLLLAFSILGAGTEIKFPETEPVFGTGRANEHMDSWLESMFFVGNQVPLIVIQKIRELSFFKGIEKTLKCKHPQQGLGRRTLQRFLFDDRNPRPTDLIHCLQLVVLGPERSGSNRTLARKDDDAGAEEDTFSVNRLSAVGIKFKKLDRDLGIRAVHYKCNIFEAILHLPVLKVDRNTGMLISSLLKYELVQQVEPEISSYLRFLGELVRTSRDVEILESVGVIQGYSRSLPTILESLDVMASTSCVKIHAVKREIIANSPWQWKKALRWMTLSCSSLMFFFAFFQMLYGILSYYEHT